MSSGVSPTQPQPPQPPSGPSSPASGPVSGVPPSFQAMMPTATPQQMQAFIGGLVKNIMIQMKQEQQQMQQANRQLRKAAQGG